MKYKKVTWEDLDDFVEDVASSVCLSELAMDKDIHDDKETRRRDRKEDALEYIVSIRLFLNLLLAAFALVVGLNLIDDSRLCDDLPFFRFYGIDQRVLCRSVGET